MTEEQGRITPQAAPWAMLYLALCATSGRAADAEAVEAMDLGAVLACAKRQELVACVFEALKPFAHREELFRGSLPRWEHERKLALRRSLLFESEFVAVRDFLETNGIPYMPLKGITLAPLYPASHLRDMSDVDIWYDKTHRDRLVAFFGQRGYSWESIGNHDIFTKPPIYNFEMHTALFSSVTEADFANYYMHFEDKMQKNDSGCGYHFRAEDTYIYLILHEYRHAKEGGVGVRYLLDRYRFALAHPTLDGAYIERELARVGALDYRRDTEALIAWLFADPARIFCEGEGGHMTTLCAEFLFVGVHGSYDRKLEQELRRASGGERITRRGRLRWMWGRLFPSRDFMRYYAAHHCPRAFRPLPLAYLYRILRAVGKAPRLLRRARSVK